MSAEDRREREEPADIDEFVRSASRFQRPQDLGQLLERYRGKWTRHELFNNPKLKPFNEAWQAVMFGIGYEELTGQPVEVRICHPAQFPDFEAKIGGQIHEFESRIVTMKRLGAAYRGDENLGPVKPVKPAKLPPFDPTPIRDAVRDKAAKNYAAKVNLLLYASYPGKNAQFPDVVNAVNEGGGDKFESVWVVLYDYIGCPRPSERLARCDGWLRLPTEGPLLEGEEPPESER